jgi:phosphoribosylcarboxyaminoimidazole (NCAIR) mutase
MQELVIIAGSESDREFVEPALKLAEGMNIKVELKVYSAHRDLEDLLAYLEEVEKNGKNKGYYCSSRTCSSLAGNCCR